jgi:hypothetical protein
VTLTLLLGGPFASKVHFSRLLPRSLASVVRAHNVAELHLTLASGRWDYERWGDPKESGAAAGAEAWAWLEVSDEKEYVGPLPFFFFAIKLIFWGVVRTQRGHRWQIRSPVSSVPL